MLGPLYQTTTRACVSIKHSQQVSQSPGHGVDEPSWSRSRYSAPVLGPRSRSRQENGSRAAPPRSPQVGSATGTVPRPQPPSSWGTLRTLLQAHTRVRQGVAGNAGTGCRMQPPGPASAMAAALVPCMASLPVPLPRSNRTDAVVASRWRASNIFTTLLGSTSPYSRLLPCCLAVSTSAAVTHLCPSVLYPISCVPLR